MPIISYFYGITIKMYFNDERQHKLPHVHAEYGDYQAVFDLKGNLLNGKLPFKKNKIVEAWIIIHEEDLNNLWKVIQEDNDYFKIEPLK